MENDFKVISTQYHMGRNTQKLYIIGFVLSIVLTIVPYVLVTDHFLDTQGLILAIVALALAQFLVQVVFFLHLSTKRWNMIVFIFTIFVVVIVVGGSLWIMYNLKYNMTSTMPIDSNTYMLKQNEGRIPQ